jgi:phosphatidylglycerol:prolipoprotein diacylglycerol transferase
MNGGIILPQFDPFLINFGGFGIRWYALAYIAGLLGGYWILRREAGRHPRAPMPVEGVDSLLNHVLLGVILGGRLGYVIFYNPAFFLANPLDIIKVWQGGMSFHGGLLGVTVSMWLFARRWRIPVLAVSDRVAMVLPIGLLLGRLSNFINAELYGRVTDLPWGMVFPGSDSLPRHPSQLYEAGLEGLALGMVMFVGWRRGWLRRTGTMTAVLLVGYGSARFLVEYVREPDAHLGLMLGMATMGQILCLPMLAAGGWILWRRRGA